MEIKDVLETAKKGSGRIWYLLERDKELRDTMKEAERNLDKLKEEQVDASWAYRKGLRALELMRKEYPLFYEYFVNEMLKRHYTE